jgi:hypothetical protein
MTARLTQRADEDALCRCLEGVSAVAAIERVRSADSSSYASEVVTVRLASGEEFRLFLKDFGSSRLAKDDPERQRDRELRVYRDLLAEADLGTAGYRGSVWDGSEGRFWLLLEYVDAVPLNSCRFEWWVAAAGWLGRLHGHFARHADRLRGQDFLLAHDRDFFWSKARLALVAVSGFSAPLARRLADILSGYGPCVEVMVRQPPTLVHGSYKPRHILVSAGAGPLRICPVDWELAAAGSGLYDLAFLSAGVDPPRLERMFDAYRREALAQGVPLPSPEEMSFVVDCFRLHKVLKSLGGARERTFPESKVAKLVDLGEQLSDRLPRPSDDCG